MTSFAFILGVVPLADRAGAGAEMRQALGTAVFAGMLGVTLFGIFLTPVFYVLTRRIELRLGATRGARSARRSRLMTSGSGTGERLNRLAQLI